jgi:1-acyl-sn-glycerol-3-phosphate acyltransferase
MERILLGRSRLVSSVPERLRLLLSAALEGFYRHGARVLMHLLYRIEVEGKQHIPEQGGAILIANHVAYMDGLLIHTALPQRRVYFVIDKAIYSIPAVKHFMDICGAIPIEPTKESVTAALAMAREVLARGELVCIFPEGQLTYTGHMSRFRFGIEWMAQGAKVPVIPMGIHGLWGSIFSRKYLGSRWWFLPKSFRRKLRVKIGAAIPWQEAKIHRLPKEVMFAGGRRYELAGLPWPAHFHVVVLTFHIVLLRLLLALIYQF